MEPCMNVAQHQSTRADAFASTHAMRLVASAMMPATTNEPCMNVVQDQSINTSAWFCKLPRNAIGLQDDWSSAVRCPLLPQSTLLFGGPTQTTQVSITYPLLPQSTLLGGRTDSLESRSQPRITPGVGCPLFLLGQSF
jgi:hypothetical protein